LAQLEANATLTDATNALNAKLAEELRAAKAQLNAPPQPKPEPQPAATTTVAPPATFTATTMAAEGVAPFASNSAPVDPASRQTLDPAAEFDKRFNELRARGMKAVDAARRVWHTDKELAVATLNSHAAKSGRKYD
jgi:hypothetical protein